MKKLIFISLSVLYITVTKAQHTLAKQWQTDTTLAIPESVLYDAQNKVLYASLIDGDPGAKDGKGEIARIGLDGKIINASWITGLNCPKGLGINGNTLYAADADEVVVIDISKGTVTKKIPVKDAQFLNDVVFANGVVYVSDSRTGKVHKIVGDSVNIYAEGFSNPNGVLALGDKLLVLAKGELYSVDDKGSKTKLAEGMDESTDGIEEAAPGEYIVSCWSGVVYYVKADGSKQEMLNTKAQNSNTADIGYDKENKIVYTPTFFKKSVVAYKLQ